MSEDDWPLPIYDPLAWFDTAACKTSSNRDDETVRRDVERMFTYPNLTRAGERGRGARFDDALAMCDSCPHKGFDGPCVALWASLDDDGQRMHGVWGGFTAGELLAAKDSGRTPAPSVSRVRFGSTREMVRHAIAEGATTVPMLTETLGLTKRQVGSALAALANSGRIRRVVPGGGRNNVAVWEAT